MFEARNQCIDRMFYFLYSLLNSLTDRRISAMEISKLSSKGQVTLPKKIRECLGLHPGDLISYVVDEGIVSIRRLESFDAAFHSALSGTLEEWNTPEDDEAFRDL